MILQSGILSGGLAYNIYTVTLFCQIGAYILAALVVLRRYRVCIKDEYSAIDAINLSWLSFVLYGYLCSWFTSVTSFVLHTTTGSIPTAWSVVSLFAFFIFFNVIFYKGLIRPELFGTIEEKPRYSTSKLGRDDADAYAVRLGSHMDTAKPYLDPGITLKQLAEQLSIQPRFLSQVINEHYRKNFFDFINQFRIEEAKRMIMDPGSARKTMLAILLESGFNSKSSFNAAFKKQVGMTPTQFRDHA